MKSIQRKLYTFTKRLTAGTHFFSIPIDTTDICFFIIAIITCIALYFKIF